MKKSAFLKVICFSVCTLMLFIGATPLSSIKAFESTEKVISSVSDEQFIKNVNNGISEYSDFIKSMKVHNSESKQLLARSDAEKFVKKYNDDYAGTYVDEEGIINVCVTESANNILPQAAKLQMAKSQNVDTQAIKYQFMKYSYNELDAIAKTLISVAKEFSIASTAIKQRDNKVNIFYSDESKLPELKCFINNSGYPNDAIEFIYQETATLHRKIYAGDEIYYRYGFLWLSTSSGTIGAHVVDNDTGRVGVLTNAHVAPSDKTMKHEDGDIGEATKRKYGGTIDAAFIPYDSPSKWEITKDARAVDNTSHIFSNTDYSDNDTWTAEGMRVRKFGITTGTTNGTITHNSMYASIGDENENYTNFSDMLRYTNNSQGGDSGGPVYAIGGPRGSLWFIGIHVAGSRDDDGEYGFGCKAKNIFTELNLRFYK